MRESKRDQILDAAARVVQRDGLTSVTYETVAAEAGLTKGGLVYHFPSREALLTAVHQHHAAAWEAGMSAAIGGKTAEEATQTERLQGYARGAMQSATRAELLFMLEGVTTPEHAAVWNDVIDRWVPAPPTDVTDEWAVTQFITRLAADGLWVYESLSDRPLDPGFRAQIADLIAERLVAAEPATDEDGQA